MAGFMHQVQIEARPGRRHLVDSIGIALIFTARHCTHRPPSTPTTLLVTYPVFTLYIHSRVSVRFPRLSKNLLATPIKYQREVLEDYFRSH